MQNTINLYRHTDLPSRLHNLASGDY